MQDRTRLDVGISVSQSGVPVDIAPDYKKVLDSRWRFLEVAFEVDISFSLPSMPLGSSYENRRINLFRHGLNFVPGIETTVPPFDNDYSGWYGGIRADDEWVYASVSIIGGSAIPAKTVSGLVTVYNLPVLENYEAPKEIVSGGSSAIGDVGVMVLDRSDRSVSLGDNSSTGYSLDTTQKILSIHKHGVANINETLTGRVEVASVNASTDVITFSSVEGNTDWLTKVGAPVTIAPYQSGAAPAPLVAFTQTYDIIPVGTAGFRLATTQANANAGNYINLTSSGTLPMAVMYSERITGDRIVHDVGYPPTYLLALAGQESDGKWFVRPFFDTHVRTTLVFATSRELRIQGVQALPIGHFAYVVLKDPAEIAE